MNADAARAAAGTVMVVGAILHSAQPETHEAIQTAIASMNGQLDDETIASMAAFARRVGRACSPHVMGSHLHMEKRRADPEPSRVEVIAYQAFITVLLDLDDLKTTIAAEKARAAAQAQPVAPTPIEDTILEEVDDFFAKTW